MSDQSVFAQDGSYLGEMAPIDGGGYALVDPAGQIISAVDEHHQPISLDELQLDTGGYTPDHEAMHQRIAQLEAVLAADDQGRQQAAGQQQQIDALEEHAEQLLDELGVTSDEQRTAVIRQAATMRPGEDGMLDVQAAHDALYGAHQAEADAYAIDHPVDDRPAPDADSEEWLQWQTRQLEDRAYAEQSAQRRAVEAGDLDARDASRLPAWEREGREPAGMEDGHPDPTTAEGQAYMAQRLDDLNTISGE